VPTEIRGSAEHSLNNTGLDGKVAVIGCSSTKVILYIQTPRLTLSTILSPRVQAENWQLCRSL